MKRIGSVILAGALALTATAMFAACNDDGKKQEEQSQSVLLYDFEDYDRNYSLMRVMSYFGAVNVNRNAQYVKNGEGSALLQPLMWHSTMIGNTYSGIKPESCLYIPFSSNRYEFDYSDAGKIQTVRFAMYNAEEDALPVYAGLVFDKNVQTVSEPVKFTLKPGWNDVFYTLDHNALAINYDLSGCYGLALSFDRVGSRDLADAPKVYLDDLYLDLTATSVTTTSVITLDENEICDFEKLYQRYTVTSYSFDKALRPDLDIVTAADYGLTAPSGHKVLRAVLKPTDAIDGTIYDQILLTQALIDAVGFDKLPDDAYFCFDFYNDNDVPMDLSVTFLDTKNSGYKVARHLYANPRQWTAYRIRIADVDALWGEDENTYRNHPGPIRIEWAEFTDAERVIYVDNFRIEK